MYHTTHDLEHFRIAYHNKLNNRLKQIDQPRSNIYEVTWLTRSKALQIGLTNSHHNIFIEFGSLWFKCFVSFFPYLHLKYESIVDVTIAKKKVNNVGVRKLFSEAHLNSLEKEKKRLTKNFTIESVPTE